MLVSLQLFLKAQYQNWIYLGLNLPNLSHLYTIVLLCQKFPPLCHFCLYLLDIFKLIHILI